MPEVNVDVFIIAGESSGDLHSAHLLNDIKISKPDISVSAVGGSKLRKAGADIILDYSEINFVGFAKIISNYFYLKRKFNFVKDYILKNHPKTVILCDFPGFNLRIAKSIRKIYKGKIIYYITPQIWAWNPGRIKIIRDCVDICLVVFPFEKKLFDANNVKNYYIGHPLVRQVKIFLNSFTPRKTKEFTVSLMPGSRTEEISRILPLMNNISKILTAKFRYRVKLICSDNVDAEIYARYYNDPYGEIVQPGNLTNLSAIAESDFVITKFGTSNLEAALLGIPFCAVYRAGILNYIIAKLLIKIKFVSLVNIIFDKDIVREFIQKDFTVDNVISEIEKVKNDSAYREKMLSEFKGLSDYFDTDSCNASELVLKELYG